MLQTKTFMSSDKTMDLPYDLVCRRHHLDARDIPFCLTTS